MRLAGPIGGRPGVLSGAGPIFLLLFAVVSTDADARRLFVQGLMGPIVSRNVAGNPFLGIRPNFTRRGFANGRRTSGVGQNFGGLGARVGNGAAFSADARALGIGARLSALGIGNFGGIGAGIDFFEGGPPVGAARVPGGAAALSPNPLGASNRSVGGPLGAGGCGVVVNGTDGHGGAPLCRDPRAGVNATGGGARPEAPIAQLFGPDGRMRKESCGNLAKTICGGQSAAEKERLVFAEGRKIVNAYAPRKNEPALATVFANVLRNPGRFFGQYADYLRFVQKEAGAFDQVATKTLSRVRDSIDALPFPPGTKDAMKAKFDGMTLSLVPSANLTSLRSFVSNCGADGMTPSAYAVPERKEIVVCPGMALRAKALGGSLLSNLLHVLAHECGHHCGADKFDGGGQSEFRKNFLSFGACLKTRDPSFDPNGMLGEAVADAIGYGAVAKEVAGMSHEAAFAFVKQSSSALCGTQSDGHHPAGEFRLNVLLGENPEILEAIGCDVPRGACAMDGSRL